MTERPRFAEEEGISLIEVLVAIMLLGLIMGAMARSLTTSLFSTQKQERQVHATSLVRELLEEARGLPWTQLGLCQDDVAATWGIPPGGTYSHASGPETVVQLAMQNDICSPLSDAPLRAASQQVRNGVTYDLLTVVTWTDDPLDGTKAAGTDADGEDLKHVWVQATWDSRGQPATTVSETYVAEDATSPVLSTEVIHDPPTAAVTYTYLNKYDGLDNNDGLTQEDVLLRATATTPQSGVVVRWLKADGNYISPIGMTPADGGHTFTWTIPNGSPDFDMNRLANGETVFEFTASDAATGRQTVVFDRGLFLIEPGGVGVSSATLIDASGPASTLRVDTSGVPCTPTRMEIFVDGLLRSDFSTAAWTGGLSGQQSMEGVETSLAHRGASFKADIQGPVGGLVDSDGDEVVDSGSVTASFYLQRNGDSYTLGQNPATTSMTTWDPQRTFAVEVAC